MSKVEDYLNKTVIFESAYGSFKIPVRDYIDEDTMQEFLDDTDNEEEIEMSIIDCIYYDMDFDSKLV